MSNKMDQLIGAALTLLLLCFFCISPALGEPTGTIKKIPRDSGIAGISAPTVSEFSKNTASGLDSLTKKKTVSLEDAKVNETKDDKEEEEEDPSLADKLNPLTIGKKMVGEGGIYFLELLGDAGFQTGGNNSTSDTVSVKENYGQAVAMIYTLATIEFDPFQNPFIKDMQLKFGIVGLFIIIMFIILGAFNVNIYAMTSARHAEKAWILSNRYHLPINEYALTIAEACIMMSAGYAILRITILIEMLFTKLIMFQILDRIVPTGGNIVMYLMMSLCYLIIGIAIAYRILIIGIFCASYIVFIGLYCFGITRPAAIAAWWYYIKILFMRTIIVAVTSIGVGIISYVGPIGGAVDPFSKAGQVLMTLFIHPILYGALVLILVIICIMFIVGIKNVMTVSRTVIRRYTYGAYH